MSKSNIILPEPRRAADELPDQAAVDAAGINLDLETARLVACVIFRQAIKGRSQSRTMIHDTELGLAFMARERLDRNGEHELAPFPGMHLNRWPQGPEYLSSSASPTASLSCTASSPGSRMTTPPCRWTGRSGSTPPRSGQ